MPVGMIIGGEGKDKVPEYPTSCIHDLPKGVDGIKVGDSITIQARVKSMNLAEEGIRSMDIELMNIEDGKKDTNLKKKKVSDEDIISKGVDEAADEADADDEE